MIPHTQHVSSISISSSRRWCRVRQPHDVTRREDVTVDSNLLADLFERDRPRLRAVAYRMLGSIPEADDAVQEAWLRLSGSDADAVRNLSGWLTTVVARVSLDMLRSRRARAEQPLDGERLTDPIVQLDAAAD